MPPKTLSPRARRRIDVFPPQAQVLPWGIYQEMHPKGWPILAFELNKRGLKDSWREVFLALLDMAGPKLDRKVPVEALIDYTGLSKRTVYHRWSGLIEGCWMIPGNPPVFYRWTHLPTRKGNKRVES